MDTIIGALKDLGEKKWIINILLPAAFFISTATLHLALINNSFSGLFLWWAGLALDAKIFIGIIFTLVCLCVAAFFDFGTDTILGLFTGFDSGFEMQSSIVRWIHGIGRSYYLRHFHQQNQR
jgi:hypothetical protein